VSGTASTGPGRRVEVSNRHPSLRIDRRGIARAVRVLDANHAALATRRSGMENAHDLSLAFLTDGELALLHGRFLADPSETDVITFEGRPSLGVAGEICVSADAAARYAGARGADLSGELTLYLVHGWLHLAGHDDRAPAARRAMRGAEARALALLRAAGALPRFTGAKKTRARRPVRG
jgi:probable rRNA maturation factor